jgi:hypothetical protein
MEFEKYKKYRWFFTSAGKLVIGGKSAEQNDELLLGIKNFEEELIVMHTAEPGSPFSVIMSEIKKISKKDLEECAIFTGCFSRVWRSGKKNAEIHIFKKSQIYKDKKMKTGTWGVLGEVEKKKVELKLTLIRQEGVLRAVPETAAKKKEILAKLAPGKIEKTNLADMLKKEKKISLNEEELASATPSGGFKLI